MIRAHCVIVTSSSASAVKGASKMNQPGLQALARAAALSCCALVQPALCDAQSGPVSAPPQGMEVLPIHAGVYLIAGAGANIVAQTGNDGVALIDAGAPGSSTRVLAALASVTNQPIRYIVDTSADAEAAGGNGALARAGKSIYLMGAEFVAPPGAGTEQQWASVLATSQVLTRMATPDAQAPSLPQSDWPTVAITAPPYYIYFNHEAIELYPQAGHDDTDTLVFLRSSDVMSVGELINADRFPVIDVRHGGSIDGEIAALNHILTLSDTSLPFAWRSEGTVIVPSHGRMYLQADVARYRDMVVKTRDIIQSMIDQHLSLAQIQAASPCAAYETEYGGSTGPWTTVDFVRAIYQSLTARAKR
jgi:glyoxylase-like metal-dependent hydrolase (beta-lactamase superfamily II)